MLYVYVNRMHSHWTFSKHFKLHNQWIQIALCSHYIKYSLTIDSMFVNIQSIHILLVCFVVCCHKKAQRMLACNSCCIQNVTKFRQNSYGFCWTRKSYVCLCFLLILFVVAKHQHFIKIIPQNSLETSFLSDGTSSRLSSSEPSNQSYNTFQKFTWSTTTKIL